MVLAEPLLVTVPLMFKVPVAAIESLLLSKNTLPSMPRMPADEMLSELPVYSTVYPPYVEVPSIAIPHPEPEAVFRASELLSK